MAESSENRLELLNFWGKRATSFVWNYFGFEADSKGRYKDPKKAICRICHQSIKYFGNTTNMAHHLSTHNDIVHTATTSAKIEVVEPTYQSDSNESYEPPVKIPRSDLIVVEFWSKTKRSVVWEYFGFYATADGEYVDKNETVCKICQTCLRYNGNTTNLANHLLRYHGIEGILTSHDPNLCLASDETAEKVNQILKAASILQNKTQGAGSSDKSDTSSPAFSSQFIYPGGGSRSSPSGEGSSGLQVNFTSSTDHVTTTTNEVGFVSKRKLPHPAIMGTIENVGITSDRLSTITTAIGQYLLEERLTTSHVTSPGFVRFVQSLDGLYKMPSSEFFKGSVLQRKYDEINIELNGIKSAKRHVLTEHIWYLRAHDSKTNDQKYTTLVVNYINEDCQQKSHILQTVEGEIKQSVISDVCKTWGLRKLVFVGSHYRYDLNSETITLPCFGATIKSALLKCFQHTQIRDMLLRCAKDCLENLDTTSEESLAYVTVQLSLGHGVQGNPWQIHEMLDKYQTISTKKAENDVEVIIDILKSVKTALDMLTSKGSTAALILPTLYKLINKQFSQSDEDSDVVGEVKSSLVSTLTNAYLTQGSTCSKLLRISTVIDPRLKSLYWMSKDEKESCYDLLHAEALEVLSCSEELLNIKMEPDEDNNRRKEDNFKFNNLFMKSICY